MVLACIQVDDKMLFNRHLKENLILFRMLICCTPNLQFTGFLSQRDEQKDN